jgi:hypothetical protein
MSGVRVGAAREPSSRIRLVAACLALACAPRTGHPAEGTHGPASAASLNLAIRIPRITRLVLLDHPSVLTIAAGDLARGALLVSGVRMAITSNSRRALVLRAELVGDAVQSVEVLGLGEPLAVSAGGNTIALPPMKSSTSIVPVEYRIRLSPAAVAGNYRWPVVMSIEDP